MKVLFITDKSQYEHRMSMNHSIIMREVSKRYDVVDQMNLSELDVKNYDIVVNDGWTDFSETLVNHKGNKIVVGKFYEDLWQIYESGERNIATEYDFVINRYKDDTTVTGLFCSEVRKYYIPHHHDYDMFMDWGLEKEYDIFVYGFAWRKLYPWRWKMFKFINRELSNRFNVKFLSHPGYGDKSAKNAVRGEDLSRMINKSWLGFCTSESHGPYTKRNNPLDYWYKKYHETSLSGTVVLGSMPTEAEYLYQDDYIHIDNHTDGQRMIEIIGEALADKDKLREMASRVRQRYFDANMDMANYTVKLNKIFEDLLNDS